jgi:hypothetical protein
MKDTNSRTKKGITLGIIVLAFSMGVASPKLAYAPQESMQLPSAQKIEVVQAEEQAAQAEQEKKPKSADRFSYAVDCAGCPGMYAYSQKAQNTYFLLPHRRIVEITLMAGDSYNRYQENEGWPENYPPRSSQLLLKLLHYVNKEPFDAFDLKEGNSIRVIDFDGDGFVMKRAIEFYGRKLTAEEMDETIKHNDEYNDKVNEE